MIIIIIVVTDYYYYYYYYYYYSSPDWILRFYLINYHSNSLNTMGLT